MDRNIQSQLFFSLRGIAIISVAFAHSLSFPDGLYQRIGAAIGILGVPIFLFCSGYYHKQLSWNELNRKLTAGIIIPWLIWGTFAFFISYILGAVSCNLQSFFAFIVGHKTWLYYIPVYLIIRIIFIIGNVCRRPVFLSAAIAISIVSGLVSFAPPREIAFGLNWLTPWQNPLNWAGFFSLGIIFKQYDLLGKIKNLKLIGGITIFVIFILSLLTLIFTDLKINYWNPYGIILNYASIAIIPFMIFIHKIGVLVTLGRYSYLIYLLHIQIGIALTNIIYRIISPSDLFTLLTKPFVVLAVTMILIMALKYGLALLKLIRLDKYVGIPS